MKNIDASFSFGDRFAEKPKSKSELRKYGLVMSLIIGLIATLLVYKKSKYAVCGWGISGIFFVLALVFPMILAPVEKFWTELSKFMSRVVTPFVFGIVFFLAFAPVGLLIRLFGKDMLNRKIKKDSKSYWIEINEFHSKERNFLPY